MSCYTRENPIQDRELTPQERELVLHVLEVAYQEARERCREVENPRGGREEVVSLDSLRSAFHGIGASLTADYPDLIDFPNIS